MQRDADARLDLDADALELQPGGDGLVQPAGGVAG
jgi:hypothetical protein